MIVLLWPHVFVPAAENDDEKGTLDIMGPGLNVRVHNKRTHSLST